MPKLIEHGKERLLAAARQELKENGYSSLTIRSLATSCGMAVGTVYHYFPGKDELIAAYLIEDWQAATASLNQAELEPMDVIEQMFLILKQFHQDHSYLFQDPEARQAFSLKVNHCHDYLSASIRSILDSSLHDGFLSQMIGELLITYSLQEIEFCQLSPYLKRLVQGGDAS